MTKKHRSEDEDPQARETKAERAARIKYGESPLRTEDRYNRANGDLELHDPVTLPLDERIADLCGRYALLNAKARKVFRRFLVSGDLLTLLDFSERAAALALRTRDTQWLVAGLTAIAMLDVPRIDWRDWCGAPGIIYAAFHYLREDSRKSFADAAKLASARVADALLSFADRPDADKNPRVWLFEIIETPKGAGLIRVQLSTTCS